MLVDRLNAGGVRAYLNAEPNTDKDGGLLLSFGLEDRELVYTNETYEERVRKTGEVDRHVAEKFGIVRRQAVLERNGSHAVYLQVFDADGNIAFWYASNGKWAAMKIERKE